MLSPQPLISCNRQVSRNDGGWLLLLAALLLFLSGCKTLRLPAIDPNGGRIFSGGSTTFVSPHGPGSGYPQQGPMYQAPPEPKKCAHGAPMGANHLGHGCSLCQHKGKGAATEDPSEIRGRCGEILLTPTRLVAPVGGEVILLAGICGKDGMLVTGEPIEWMLSPESVGQIIAVGDDAPNAKSNFWTASTSSSDPKVEKLDVDYARGRTSREAGMITRGTSRRDDDLPIRKGQTWLSLSSPSEGVSKVTVMAPDSDAWDKRRQTATVYWIDAGWEFPKPQMASSGTQATLLTKVSRADGYAPANGWKVRYRSLNPNFARFLPSLSEVAEVLVDDYGAAKIDVINMVQQGMVTQSNGTGVFEIEIVRPMDAAANMPELQISRGTAEVTWNAPDVQLKVRGPEVAVPGQPLAYSATIENLGYMPAENTILSVAIPQGMRFQSSSVQATRQAPTALAWEIGPLGARQAFDVEILVVPEADLDVRVVFEVTHAPNVSKTAVVSTVVHKPQLILSVQADPNSTRVPIGDIATFQMKLTNTGNQVLNDVSLLLEAQPGLEHIRDGASTVTRPVGMIAPGQTMEVSAQFVVRKEGELGITATAKALEQILASQRAFLQGLPAAMRRPMVEIELKSSTGANAIPVNSETLTEVLVRNTGPIPIRDLLVSINYDPQLTPRFASSGYEENKANAMLWWRIPQLPAGTNIDFKVNFTAIAPSQGARVVVQAETSDQSIKEVRNLSIPILAPNAPVGGGNAPLPNGGNGLGGAGPTGTAPGAGMTIPARTDLNVAIEPISRSVKLNESSQFVIRIRNQSPVNQQQVALQLQLPEGVRLAEFKGQTDGRYSFDDTGKIITTEPIQTLRSSEEYQYILTLTHQLISEGRLVATIRSDTAPEPVSASSIITTTY